MNGQRPEELPARDHLREAWRDMWTSEPFGAVLLLVFASFVFLESAPDTEWASVISVGLQGATLMFVLRAAKVRRHYMHIARVVVVAALITSTVAVAGIGESISQAFVRSVSVALVALAPPLIASTVIRTIFEQKRVTLQSIFGVVSIYLLLGMLFAYMYAAIGAFDDQSFFASGAEEDIQNFIYFSYVTLTTVGFGDLTAAHQLGRTLAIVEALLGQLYLITVLSVFVGNLRPRRQLDA